MNSLSIGLSRFPEAIFVFIYCYFRWIFYEKSPRLFTSKNFVTRIWTPIIASYVSRSQVCIFENHDWFVCLSNIKGANFIVSPSSQGLRIVRTLNFIPIVRIISLTLFMTTKFNFDPISYLEGWNFVIPVGQSNPTFIVSGFLSSIIKIWEDI